MNQGGGLLKTFVSGIVIIGLVATVGLRAAGLSKVGQTAGTAGTGLLKTAEGR